MNLTAARFPRILLTCALALAAGCSAKQPASLGVAAQYWPTHGWRHSSPEAQGMDSATLAEAFDFIRERRIPIHSLQIARNGFLVLDAYFWPFEDGQLHDLASVTKSVTSTLVGIAIGQGKLRGVDQPLLSAFDQYKVANRDARKERITLGHLLTMTSGLDCRFDHGEITLSQMMASPHWVQFMLDLPIAAEPGREFEYCSGAMHVLSAVVARATGTTTLDYARHELFAPLGIEHVAWPADPQGVNYGWGDLHLQPRDMAKLGHLWLHAGRWEDRQVVPANWMRAAVQVHSHPGWSDGQEYGYAIWVYPDRNPPVFEGLGRGGQRISVMPAANLVVVFTGGGFEPGDIGAFIGHALASERPLPDNPAAAARLAAAVRDALKPPLASATLPAPPLAAVISGSTYTFEDNPIGLKSLSLSFPGGAEASLLLDLGDRTDGPRPVGLDGVPRLSPGGRFGLPVALCGAWEGDDTFVFDYDEVGNINSYRFRLRFSGRQVAAELAERTGLVEALFRGTSNSS